ncbi:hypothetical protein RB595_008840 [Gaeumannomyces hyphopodioides]
MVKSSRKDFHVAIVGAGVGGLALAMGLHKKGVSFTLYEEAKEYSVVGAGIGCPPNGMRVMDAIEPRFRALYDKVCVGNKSEDAQSIFFEVMLLEQGVGRDRPWHGKSGWGHHNYLRKSAHRKALLDIMTSFIPIESVKFNKRLAGVEQGPAGVTIRFSDGTSAEADVLAGADGIQSTARAHVLHDHPSQITPVYAGHYCYRGVIPMSEAHEILGDLTDVAKLYFGRGRGAVTYRISAGKEFNFLLLVDDPEGWKVEGAVTERTSHEAMMADFADPAIDGRFRLLLSKAQPIKWGMFHHAQTATYVRDRVMLIGDSAHASMPFQALGAAMGLEDALVLQTVLAELAARPERGAAQLPAVRAAGAAYDALRRPRAQKQLEQAAEVGTMVLLRHERAGDDVEKNLAMLQDGRTDWLWFHDVNDDAREALSSMRNQLGPSLQAARI